MLFKGLQIKLPFWPISGCNDAYGTLIYAVSSLRVEKKQPKQSRRKPGIVLAEGEQ